MSFITSALVAAIIAFVCLYAVRQLVPSSSLPLPPGPKPLPLIGNAHQAPKSHAWFQFTKWGREYGPIFYMNMLGQPLIVLSTSRAAHELLSKRGATFSDRPKMFVAQELALKNLNVLLMDYHERFRLRQRLENTVLNQGVSAKYRVIQALESKQLLFDLLKNASGKGADVHNYFERSTASTIFALFYGHRIMNAEDPDLLGATHLNDEFSEFVQVGRFLVDTFPALNILPGPMAPWKKMAESHFQRRREMHIRSLDRGLKEPGWTFSKQLHKTIHDEQLPLPYDELAAEFGTLVLAALDGTVETMMWFVIACITQDRGFVAKAQRQLDEVVGRDRLPSFDDKQKLWYITAILEEMMRWRPVGAGGVPHFTKVESTYEGYRIPAGSIVIANHWAITREEAVFGPDVEDFMPERWVAPDTAETGQIRDLPVVGFGYGRRTCPGRHFARNILWISMARVLWAFKVKAGLDEQMEETVVEALNSTDGLVMRPLAFKASFEPRDQNARQIDHRARMRYNPRRPRSFAHRNWRMPHPYAQERKLARGTFGCDIYKKKFTYPGQIELS
ncbi:uncharacterized protein E0L32_007047 [Thyridium curvatum]|uniref:Cytochrome P450 n=1 Tax=Thyridium curvatum TaxID=1093900 RepID=A0A507B522_9PEZI|nr:uncharacterized protein E0L32_007047 [Thyridium curvatum]TPX12161.1 hypothetical protein E0L32_007047 [Thyridium curvatum]